jgi:HEAT repeat protein
VSTEKRFRTFITKLKNPDYHIRNRAISSLARLNDPRAIPFLLVALGEFDPKDEESKVNISAGSAILHFGEPVAEILIAALQPRPDELYDGWRRYWVARTLGLIRDPRATQALIAALSDTEHRVVSAAAEGLGQIGDAEAISPLEAIEQTHPFPAGYLYTAVKLALERIRQKQAEAES